MPRNGSGTQIPPAGTAPLVANTVATAATVESRLADAENEITQSLPRNGSAAMTAALRGIAGSLSAPGYTFDGATNNGLALISGAVHIVVGGVSMASATSTTLTFPQAVSFTGAVNVPPTGVIMPFAGSAAPTGYVLCAGQAISRATFAALFAVIGTTYGAGDGSTTFNVPDLRGRVVAGLDNMGGTDANRMAVAGSTRTTIGGTFGADTYTQTVNNLPAHAHGATTGSAGNHTHNISYADVGPAGGTPIAAFYAGSTLQWSTTVRTATADGAGDHTHPVTVLPSGLGLPHTIVQPTAFLNYIIKT